MAIRYQFSDMMRKTMFRPWSAVLEGSLEMVNSEFYPLKHTPMGRMQAASLESIARLMSEYPKRGFGITGVDSDGRTIPVTETTVLEKPFCNLVRFRAAVGDSRPKVLFVAALAGHHATLARETYAAFLPEYDVYVTDWQDARHVPLDEGRFGFEEYVRYVVDFIDHLGPDTHVVAICQATVPVLTAVAAMAGRGIGKRPRSMTLMAGPIDISVNPNIVTRLTQLSNPELQRLLTVMPVPPGYPGEGRRVYPGLLQLFAFLGFNWHSHLQKHQQFFFDLYNNEHHAADKHREFYDEFFSVLDVTEEFYMETLERVFFDQHLPRGIMQFEGAPVDCGAITDVPLLTVEGEEDDMCQVGMTAAAHDLCARLPESHKHRHVQPGVGHYGVFNGSRYRGEVAPRIKKFMAASAT